MPKAVSRKQYRMFQAILHGKKGRTARGDSGPPKSIAEKYDKPDKGATESKGKEHKGGRWDGEKKGKKKDDKKEDVKKSISENVDVRPSSIVGVGVIVTDDEGQILCGVERILNVLTTLGGHVEKGETPVEAAKRELKEEAGITAEEIIEIGEINGIAYSSKIFHVSKWSGTPKDSDEVKNLKFKPIMEILHSEMPVRECSKLGLLEFYKQGGANLKKNSLDTMLVVEQLEKNINRNNTANYEISHGEALKLVGTGTFRMLRDAVKDMADEDFKELNFDTYVIHIRKHTNDMYSGRLLDGTKMVHQFTNKSLPALTAEVMSVFEWYLPEDEPVFDLLDNDDIDDSVIEGGLEAFTDHYRKHNLANIYTEVENMREEIRNGVAVDIRTVEDRVMKLFDKLEDYIKNISDKHNHLCTSAGEEIDNLENKLRDLQDKVENMSSKPSKVEAFSAAPANPDKVHGQSYMYLSRPQVIIEPNGRIHITFGGDWNPYDQENFMTDMKAKALKKKSK